jgi:hypothetical protein
MLFSGVNWSCLLLLLSLWQCAVAAPLEERAGACKKTKVAILYEASPRTFAFEVTVV